ncbi:MAG: aldehyde dehydrogenase family protein [Comamonadaceae bacterium]|nr:aldehyde dehydrogenase family protein [Comamonadaceae bacterium]
MEKFAPSFLAGMPCIAKPATATSYLTEACVRLMLESGLLPEGALQLVIGGTGDLLDRLEETDVVTFTGSRRHRGAAAHARRTWCAARCRSTPRPTSLNCAILAPDVTPDDEEFDLFVKEVAREMTVKAGQKCTAIRRAIVPRQHLDAVAERSCARGWPRWWWATRRSRACAWARWPRRRSSATWPSAWRCSPLATKWSSASATASRRWARAWPTAPSSRRRCCCAATRWPTSAVHDVEAFGPVSTLMPYDDLDEALALAARGRGSLVGTLVTHDAAIGRAA